MSKGFGCFLQVKPPPGESASVRERDLLYSKIVFYIGGFSRKKVDSLPQKEDSFRFRWILFLRIHLKIPLIFVLFFILTLIYYFQ